MRRTILVLACVAISAGASVRAGDEPAVVRKTAWETFSSVVLGFTDMVGHVTIDSFEYWNFPPATNVRSRLRITDEGWRFENVTADYCGGRMNAEAAIDFKGKELRELRFVAEYAGIHLEEFTKQVKYSVTPGRANCRISLRVTSEGLEGLSGGAEIHVRGAKLAQLPVLFKAFQFTFLSFPGMEKEDLSEVDAHMTLTPRAIVFQDLILSSKSGSFSLEADRLGTLSYKGEIDLRFKPVMPKHVLRSVPLLGEAADVIVSGIQQGIMRVRVTGTISEPRFQWAPFR